MDPQVQGEVSIRAQNLLATYGVSLTPQAELILGESMTAITEDAHRSWPQPMVASPQALKSFQADMLNALPSALANLAFEWRLAKITSFDLLHAMSGLVDHMCPFVKPPP